VNWLKTEVRVPGGREKVAVAVAEAVNNSRFMFLQLITTNNSKAND
jgi:hypothetical protein